MSQLYAGMGVAQTSVLEKKMGMAKNSEHMNTGRFMTRSVYMRMGPRLGGVLSTFALAPASFASTGFEGGMLSNGTTGEGRISVR